MCHRPSLFAWLQHIMTNIYSKLFIENMLVNFQFYIICVIFILLCLGNNHLSFLKISVHMDMLILSTFASQN